VFPWSASPRLSAFSTFSLFCPRRFSLFGRLPFCASPAPKPLIFRQAPVISVYVLTFPASPSPENCKFASRFFSTYRYRFVPCCGDAPFFSPDFPSSLHPGFSVWKFPPLVSSSDRACWFSTWSVSPPPPPPPPR